MTKTHVCHVLFLLSVGTGTGISAMAMHRLWLLIPSFGITFQSMHIIACLSDIHILLHYVGLLFIVAAIIVVVVADAVIIVVVVCSGGGSIVRFLVGICFSS